MNQNKVVVSQAQKEAYLKAILSKILFITFTDAAAMEIRVRIQRALARAGYSVEVDDIKVMTFNAFSNNIIKIFFGDLGFDKAPGVIDVNPTARAIKAVALITGDNKIDGLNYGIPLTMDGGALTLTLRVWDTVKELDLDPDEPGFDTKVLAEVKKLGLDKKMIDADGAVSQMLDHYQEYLEILKDESLITFADQDVLALQILDMHPEYLASLQLEHIIVDEFQDSNDLNMEFLRRFEKCMVEHGGTIKSIMVVGDDNQSIYGFRKANPQNMIDFDNKMGVTSTKLFMSQNFRSYSEILAPANELIKLNVNRIDKPLVAARGDGGAYHLQGYDSVDEELDAIVDKIAEMIAAGTDPKEIAILSFSKKTLGKASAKLSAKEIPWVMKAPVKLIENSRVHGAIKFMDAFKDPMVTAPYFEYLVPLTDGKLDDYSKDEIDAMIEDLRGQVMGIINGDPDMGRQKLHELLEAINVGDDELYTKWLDMMYQHGRDKEKLFKEDPINNSHPLIEEIMWVDSFVEFGADTELKMDQDYEGVVLSTAHSSKGLEWPIVFNTISDYDKSFLHKGQNILEVEETRRLLFVSMTRARNELYVTGSFVAYGTGDEEVYNQFLKELYVIRDGSTERWDAELLARAQKIAARDAERKAKNAERAKKRREEQRLARLEEMTGTTVKIDGRKKSKYATTLKTVRTDYSGKGKGTHKGGPRPLTAEEKAEYNKMTAHAVQMSISDL